MQNNNDIVINKTKIEGLEKWQRSVDGKLEKIQNRQFFEMTVIFMSIATILISHFS